MSSFMSLSRFLFIMAFTVFLAGCAGFLDRFTGSGGDDKVIATAPIAAVNSYNTFKPLLVIRFDRPGVDYAPAVQVATAEALTRYPDVSFEVVAVQPEGMAEPAAAASQQNADNVVDSMIKSGIPASRIRRSSISAQGAAGPEVHVFLR